MMWIRTAAQCGGFFRCNAGRAAVRCGSRYFRAAPGQERLNCSCDTKSRFDAEHAAVESTEQRSGACGVTTGTDGMGGVSRAYRRLPQPPTEDRSVKCCRNKATFGGPIDWCGRHVHLWHRVACHARAFRVPLGRARRNVTLDLTKPGAAPWPGACEALCTNHPSGRCRYFSHSVVWRNCILCS
eukprot:660163-Prymnesium_polylepis.1